MYENSLSTHAIAFALTIPAMVRWFQYRKFMAKNPGTKNPALFRKVVIPASLSLALTTSGLIYEYKEDFYTKTKEIENKYADLIAVLHLKNKNKEKEIDESVNK